MVASQPVGSRRATKVGVWDATTKIAIFTAFFLAFRWGFHLRLVDHLFKLDTYEFFSGFQSESDELVIQRFEQNINVGPFSGWMLLGNQLEGLYASEFGFSSWVLTMVPTLLGLSQGAGASLMYTLVATFNAALAAGAVLSLKRHLSGGAAALAFIALMQPWSVAIAKSIYHCIGLKMLPAICLMVLFRNHEPTRRTVILTTSGACLLTFLSGYAFLTLVAILPIAVLAHHSVVRNWEPRRLFRHLLSSVIGVVVGFIVAISAQFVQLSIYFGSSTDAAHKLIETIAKRTAVVGGISPPEVAESLTASPLEVLRTYLTMPVFGAISEGRPQFTNYFRVDALLVVCSFYAVITFRAQRSAEDSALLRTRERGLALAWVVSTLGPICWYLLARPHSYIHDHLNFALWWFPTIPLGLALLWNPIANGLNELRANSVATFWVIAVVLAVAISLLYSFATVGT